ncbi:hypothetical protein DNU06_07375 [Putridiphycobacter roseus]|uniref:Uncharacterized protein n=1 Tax=Putridiphycobacter roseus TaxID=2219161 RepID=A0A2W1NPT3_9FLAO|nr:hypothetical protein [Putridiphycobacter roseus]PZE17642.1 hypothetical protein DNU06_07375 [Putridiphycobacter roseus]
MKKAVFGIGFLVLGLLLGFIIGQSINVPIIKKIISKPVVDTIIQPKYVEIPVEIKTVVRKTDTVFVAQDSTGHVVVVERDSIFLKLEEDIEEEIENEDTVRIKRDKKLSADFVHLIYLSKENEDTLLQKLLDVDVVHKERILVEYWQSPINYQGYKLSKSKLIIFGMLPIKPIRMYKDEQVYYFYNNKQYYKLIESSDFKDLKNIPKPNKIND